ncbi:MAG TPA: hypothetical protein VFQ21_08010 [Gemmatimonadota bacterium]|nr:hypothetical protein [Gemmatimonadota bacterium]
MTLDEARAVALSLPGTTEEPHFERRATKRLIRELDERQENP